MSFMEGFLERHEPVKVKPRRQKLTADDRAKAVVRCGDLWQHLDPTSGETMPKPHFCKYIHHCDQCKARYVTKVEYDMKEAERDLGSLWVIDGVEQSDWLRIQRQLRRHKLPYSRPPRS